MWDFISKADRYKLISWLNQLLDLGVTENPSGCVNRHIGETTKENSNIKKVCIFNISQSCGSCPKG